MQSIKYLIYLLNVSSAGSSRISSSFPLRITIFGMNPSGAVNTLPENKVPLLPHTSNSFKRYLSENNIGKIDEKVCLEFIYQETGLYFERFECVTSNGRVNYRMRPLQLLLRYLEDGQFRPEARKTKPAFICPKHFVLEYESFCSELVQRGYKKSTVDSNTQKVQLLLDYLSSQGITSIEDATIQDVEGYVRTLENYAVKYVGTFMYVFRNFFSFLFECGYIDKDLTPILPKIHAPRNATIPYVWSKEDLQKLLGAIDRESFPSPNYPQN